MNLTRQALLVGGGAALALALSDCSADDAGTSKELFPQQTLKPNEYDRAEMLSVVGRKANHKQVFEADALLPDGESAVVFSKMQNSMNAFEFSMGVGPLLTLGVLMGDATTCALSDSMWKKYRIGAVYGFKDTQGRLAHSNIYHKAKHLAFDRNPWGEHNVYHDMSGEAVIARGGRFFVCNNALTAVAVTLASAAREDGLSVLADIRRNIMPGYLLVPAGVAAIQLAQDFDWRLYTV